jgi:hypothetical protein
VRDRKTPTQPLPFVATSDAGNAAPPIESLVDSLLVKAYRAGATFVTVEQAVVRFLIANEWHVERELPDELGPQVVRRLGVMIGVLPPRKDKFVAGRLQLRAGDAMLGLLVRIDRDDEDGFTAIVELVDPRELATRASPRIPTNHPFR